MWHLLDRLCDDERRLRHLCYLAAGMHEYNSQAFNDAYKLTSRRRNIRITEGVAISEDKQ